MKTKKQNKTKSDINKLFRIEHGRDSEWLRGNKTTPHPPPLPHNHKKMMTGDLMGDDDISNISTGS